MCAYSPDDDFQALIARIATVTIKYSQRRDFLPYSELLKD